MRVRKRISINENLYNAAVEYCKLDNRDFSKLVQESLSQMMRQYPRNPIEFSFERELTLEKTVAKLIKENEDIMAKIERLQYLKDL